MQIGGAAISYMRAWQQLVAAARLGSVCEELLLSRACSLWKVAVVGGEECRMSVLLVTLTLVEERLKDA